ncbi:TonB-dependent receptor [Pedobacter riviphilus]|uniref:TonB-dependent receptor n=1 Tax=Pedobacter riviphilus TaxID=2766984 RepID=A0ABX6TDQ2_9SPHI|nr:MULTISPECIES: TonB-dependent receptor [Pedobacter]NII85668.1 TonB-linked SusC/RagA family outer membrane protein [Pedobacter sp. SG908]NMN39416.1 TonB-linked SusC/RagA family outer membrane protein [Pedobacter sp. SG918]QNR83587.1 TonB-dependent receptor [Pedobacter riviphilus]
MRGRFTFVFFIYCLLAFPFALMAQDIPVTGKVTEQNGAPLPGATVKLDGTTRAASTDANGVFTIQAPVGAKLTINLIGMTAQTVTVPAGGRINVTLTADSKDLTEVVVVGYGTQKKSVVTGSISSVKAKDLESMPINRVEQALQGRTSGLTIASGNGQPGTSSTVRVRGYTSFASGGNNDPLWVVDGVIVDNGGIGYLNQADIESIEVLKDAASQAIYGARAANGVIIITTKKGKAGLISVNYNGFYGTSAPAKKLDLLNATQYATIRNESAANSGLPQPYANPAALGVGTDWQDQVFNDDARRQTHEFSVSGGNDKFTIYSSMGYIKQDGIVASPISKWNRANVRINSTYKPAKWITFGENLGYSHSVNSSLGNTNSEFGGPLSSAINLDPITPVVETDPALIAKSPYTIANTLRDANGFPYGISPIVGQEMTNPVAYMQTRLGNYSWDHNIVGNAFAEIEPIANLKFRSSLGTKVAFYGGDSYTPLFYLNSSSKNDKKSFYREINTVLNYNWENTLSYSRNFGKHHAFIIVGQGYYMDNNSRSLNTTYQNIIANSFYEANLNYDPGTANKLVGGGDGTLHVVNSLFTRVTYDYDEKYLFTGIIRRDGSSRFGTNNRFGYFPSFSLGWVPSKEAFWKENDIVNFLKIRGGYGVTGNDALGDFRYVSLVSSGRNYTFGTTDQSMIGWSPAALSNPDLKWEETRQTNIGFDATLFTNFTLSAEYFKKKTVGVLQTPDIPLYVGAAGGPTQNVGDMQNTGFEFELGYRKKIGEFNLGVNGNISFLKNKVTKLLPGKTFIEDNAQSFQTMGNFTRTGLGRSFNEYYGYDMLGIFQTQAEIDGYVGPAGTKLQPNAKPGDIKYANLNGDNEINSSDRTFLGSPIPKYTYGLTINLAYKNWDLVAFGNGVGGNQIFQGLRRLDVTYANWQTKILDRWTPSNPSTTMPRIVETDPNGNYIKFSKLYLEKGDYFRLKTLQVGYTLPQNVSKKIGAQKVRAYLMSENLWTITKYTGYDPEIGGTVLGVDRGVYPQARSFMIGLNVGF